MYSRFVFCCLLVAITNAIPAAGVCQDDKPAPAQTNQAQVAAADRIQIYDVPGTILFLKSKTSSIDHVQNFLDDLLGSSIDVKSSYSSYPDAIDISKPMVFYGMGGGDSQVVQLQLKNHESALALGQDKDVDTDSPFRLKDKYATESPFYSSKKTCKGLVKDNLLFAAPAPKADGKEKDDATEKSTFDLIRNAKLINDSLDPRMNDFVQRTGMGVIVSPQDTPPAFSSFLSGPIGWKKPTLNEKEAELFEKLESAVEKAKRAAMGVVYTKAQLNAELHVRFSTDDAFDGLLDFKAVQEQKFKPTVGLPANDLLASISLQTGLFASSDVTRLLLKAGVPGAGILSGVNQNAAMFQLTGNLLADTRDDIEGVRVGLYCQKKGTLSVVTIFDARKPDEFFLELEKLLLLVEPEEVEQQSELAIAEYERLISELGSKKYSIRERAETRLAIAGRRAVETLKQAIKETESGEIRMRATRLVNRVGVQKSSPRQKVDNLNFWANLDPEFVIEKGQREMFGMPARMVRARLPGSLSDEQKGNAQRRLKQLFGDQWDQIPFVRVGDQFVAMFGYDESMLQSTVENLKEQKDPLGQLAAENAPYFKEGNMQIHASFQRMQKMFGEDKGKGDDWIVGLIHGYPFNDVLTSVSLSLTPNYWQTCVNIPIEEFGPAYALGDRLLW